MDLFPYTPPPGTPRPNLADISVRDLMNHGTGLRALGATFCGCTAGTTGCEAAGRLTVCGMGAEQLVSNQGFETNTNGWVGSAGTTISSSTAVPAHGGSRSLSVTNRNSGPWQGAIYGLLGLATPGEILQASGWVRVAGDSSEPVRLTRAATCSGASTVYETVAAGTATDSVGSS